MGPTYSRRVPNLFCGFAICRSFFSESNLPQISKYIIFLLNIGFKCANPLYKNSAEKTCGQILGGFEKEQAELFKRGVLWWIILGFAISGLAHLRNLQIRNSGTSSRILRICSLLTSKFSHADYLFKRWKKNKIFVSDFSCVQAMSTTVHYKRTFYVICTASLKVCVLNALYLSYR
jgi:hypothetical protein